MGVVLPNWYAEHTLPISTLEWTSERDDEHGDDYECRASVSVAWNELSARMRAEVFHSRHAAAWLNLSHLQVPASGLDAAVSTDPFVSEGCTVNAGPDHIVDEFHAP